MNFLKFYLCDGQLASIKCIMQIALGQVAS